MKAAAAYVVALEAATVVVHRSVAVNAAAASEAGRCVAMEAAAKAAARRRSGITVPSS